MPIAKLAKIKLIALIEEKDKILAALQKFGVLQIEETEIQKEAVDIKHESKLGELKQAIRLLEAYAPLKKSFLENFVSTKSPATEEDLWNGFHKFNYGEIIEACKNHETYIAHATAAEAKIGADLLALEPWKSLPFPTKKLHESEYFFFFSGKIFKHLFEKLKSSLAAISPSLSIEIVNQNKNDYFIIVAGPKEEHAETQKALIKEGFDFIELPSTQKEISKEIESLKSQVKLSQSEVAAAVAEIQKLAVHKFQLMCAYDFVNCHRERVSAAHKAMQTAYTFVLTGFIKESLIPKLDKIISKTSPNHAIYKIEIKPDEEVPVLIENASFLKPFEVLTRIYGLPKSSEVDPTPLLSVFFILFFGMCLGDAGYGLTLILVSLWLKRKIPKGTNPSLLNLLIWGGVVTSIIGFLQGGFFGIELYVFPEPIHNAMTKIQLIDPRRDPLIMLIIALALGVVQILFGLLISMLMKFRDKKFMDGILDHGLWIYYIVSVILFGLTQAGVVTFISASLSSKLALAAVIALIITQGRKQKNILMKIGGGFLSLYSTVGFVSDILSYSRLLAIGLGTTVIAMVVNIIALMTKDSAPIIGFLIMIVILIIGHAFNLAVSTLSAFIHSARLQYVEFFSKFLEGGGKEFKPFTKETQYVKLSD
ncbi:MAG: V-type ATP synthase subunit I [Candidatus Margulisbacteria bacterium]|nr:V-type ATP synthase subunit I [Candidatus Margulisiibacteriota bacterium]MBU1021415.1 V-type ATP synthase subunit I [Candidatus Margulisiibacteriota bacterium]MBU1728336.1 V-type ATP synthase subunit I [Candidatus Margulisiibacteriota bacterium]MBU1955921.1 V-type ATP synthase subunit I [Candidatus Margulisiibacteriota bacterium]